ncbi:NAD(P)-dependent alcohol dehydrogenase [Kitasatospora sp. NPDC096147]|uniref:NAD(P)-dependent alcohol dehydrogenase n=1 Tax=Kitasatospora sp. NPDC096147 TaxID=3364093 RepID=UPI00381B451F
MRAIVRHRYGTTEVFELRELERPVPRSGEVLVKVEAAGLDRGVWHLMAGLPYLVRLFTGIPRPRKAVLGLECAGVVEQVGPDVVGLRVGDEVFGECAGAFAEYARARADRLTLRPPGLTPAEAAAVPISAVTALQGLRDVGRIAAGQRVLVIGASGGVGCYAVQLAKLAGAEVTAVCGPAKAGLVRELGADTVLDHTREDCTDGPAGAYDLILDLAGDHPLPRLRRVLAPRGTLVLAGGEGGGRVFGGVAKQLRAAVLAPFARQRLRSLLARTKQDDLVHLRELLADGRLRVVLDRTFPLAEVPDAVRYLEEGKVRGKVAVLL